MAAAGGVAQADGREISAARRRSTGNRTSSFNGCQIWHAHVRLGIAPEGYVETATPDDADLIILNTCHIREKAAEKVYSELGRMRVLKEDAARAGPPT